jgi:FtsZ-binding cell division protein ZapB
MFRNNNNSRTQTTTFTGFSNVLGSSNQTQNTTKTSQSSVRNNFSNDIMFAILTSNLQEVRRLVNSSNSNVIIDTTNNYTALHHAVRTRGNDKIIEYLLSIGANPRLKQNESKDAIDLSIEANYRFLIDKMINKNDAELDEIYEKLGSVNYEYKNIKRKNDELEEENNYLKKSQSQYVEKIEKLKNENISLKRKFDESEKAFDNLLKKVKK